MSVAETFLVPLGFDPQTGEAAALWLGAGTAALLLILGIRFFGRPGLPGLPGPARAVGRYALVALALVVGLSFLDRQIVRDRAEQRRALEMRATALTERAMAPGSPLACLDGRAGDAVEAACEAALFANPQAVAAAVAYVIARLTLLSDGSVLADRGDDGYDTILADLRRSAEADLFGIVSYVLATRDNCTPEKCAAFNLMDDSSRVKANLREQLFEKHLAGHLAAWQAAAGPASRSPPDKQPAATGSVSGNWDYPSAASIPPVSIMVSEPSGPPSSTAAASNGPPSVPATGAVSEPANAAPTPPRRPATAPSARRANAGAVPQAPPAQLGPLPPPPPLPAPPAGAQIPQR
jgi:hypothetical protein